MSLNVITTIRGYLTSSSNITSYVNANNIKVGWPRTLDRFPCIILSQAAGTAYGYLGYGTAAAGTKLRREGADIQVDIFSSKRLETIQVADEVVKVLISGGCVKNSDVETYEDEYNIYRKVQTYGITQFHND